MTSRPVSFSPAVQPTPPGDTISADAETTDRSLLLGLFDGWNAREPGPIPPSRFIKVVNRVTGIIQRRSKFLDHSNTLDEAMSHLCAALSMQGEPQQIYMSCAASVGPDNLMPHQISTILLIVNELAVNAMQHAFEEDVGGRIALAVYRGDGGETIVTVDDDGLPFPELDRFKRTGMGFDVVRELAMAIDSEIIFPTGKSKKFALRMPAPV